MRQWLLNLLIALDTAFGALFPRSLPGQTISSRAATARNHGHLWGRALCRALDWIDPGHCDCALKNDEARAAAVIKDLNG